MDFLEMDLYISAQAHLSEFPASVGSPPVFPRRDLTPAEALRLDRCRLSISRELPNLCDGPQSRRNV